MLAAAGITTQYCIVQGGHTGTGIIDKDPQFVSLADGDGADNIWFTSDDGLRLKSCSPAINRGNNGIAGDTGADIAGNLRTKLSLKMEFLKTMESIMWQGTTTLLILPILMQRAA